LKEDDAMNKKLVTIGILAFSIPMMFLSLPLPGLEARAQKDGRVHVTPIRPEEGPFVPGRVLVKFRSNIGLDHARQIVAALGAREAGALTATGVLILELPEQASEAAFVHALASRPDVEFAELDRLLNPATVTPNDPWFTNWQGNLKRIDAPNAWSTTTGASNIVIAILDTGVEATHPDLAAKLVPGWNIYNNNSNTSDIAGHGTAVAGTVAASSNNGVGVASVCWKCMIMPIRVTDNSAWASFSSIASGLNWAADHGARVANISYTVSDSATVTSSAKYFQGKGGIVAASAGNQGTFNNSSDNPYILTISATDYNNLIYSYSNRGNNIDFAAPGDSFTTVRGGAYQSVGGTSYAAPLVAGVAALVFSANPTLTAIQVKDILKNSADDSGVSGWDPNYGWGRINAAQAVSLASGNGAPPDLTPPSVSFNSPANGTVVSDNFPVVVSASDNVGVASVTFIVDGLPYITDTAAPFGCNWITTSVANGAHTLAAMATDAAGNSTTITVSVIVNNVLDTTPPAISITSPADNAKLPNNASVKVNATDNIGVTKVELYADGLLQGVSTSAPFTIKWNTAKTAKGVHTLQCKAYDAAGNEAWSQLVNVNK
jgi:subtilisin family serine protease